MTAQTFSTGNTTLSPFSSISGADYVSRYIPFNDQKSPLSGAFLATGTPGFSIGAGLLGTAVTIASATASSPSAGFVTYTTSGAHGLVASQQVTISGISSPLGYNGTFKVVSVGSTTTFTVANSTTGTFIGSGTIADTSVRSDGVYHRPIMFYSLSMPFTAASSTVQLQFATTAAGGGGNQGPSQGDAATVTWDNTNTTEFLNYAVSQCTTADAAVTYYVGFEKQDANTTTFRRGATSSSSIAPNGIYANGVLQDGTGGTTDWSGTAVRTTVSWRHAPNHPTGLTATAGTNPGEVNLSWTAPNDNGGSAVYGYRIAYKKTGDTTWYVYGTNTYMSPSNTTGTSETVKGLEPGSEYSFIVAGMNEVTDRYNGGVAYPDRTYADYSATTSHTGQNSNIAIANATALSTIDPKFGAYSQSLAKFVAATPKVQGASGIVNGVPWVYDGAKWTRSLQVTGGTKTTYTSGGITYTLHTFSTSDNFYVKECQGGLAVDYLIVAGGGGGGGRYNAGGGGGGGVLSGTMTLSSNTLYPVVVGIGGTGGAATDKGLSGKDSSFNGVTAKGGGGGGAFTYASGGDAQGLNGGSGGGNSGYVPTPALSSSTGTAGQGNNGGLGGTYGGGGGGGAGGAGSNGTASTGGSGGIGVLNSITGTATRYGGGGGGASYSSATAPSGGLGGGGFGAAGPNTTAGGVPGPGTDGLGGGGGGANGYGTTGATTVGGNGGSGVVIIRYISSVV